ncbi:MULTISPECIES: helix-turn-helix domain-containing protein [Streptosporangium]|uniref:Transcriptional regulator with XRE-family HTH domain n=1 Tax=Streptosporangium brasiliense TaxID=47480 RepID=A0ABT9R9U1_9ACTN|nr:helix-turn-helix transcriptional regulator [Streptosporangium brasiliense]MDP9866025.1 transcriptional regulator with XRE-family HTH domain [Streptosporangium brasiliense]
MLKSYRSANGLTQGELAGRLLIDQTCVSKIERGVRVIKDVDFLARVAELLGIPLNELYPGNGHPAQAGASPDPVAASQRRWLEGRRYLNRNRATLAAAAVAMYPKGLRVRDVPLSATADCRSARQLLSVLRLSRG